MEKYFTKLDQKRCFEIDALRNKSIVVTGATGYIGSNLVKYLLHLNSVYATNISITGYCTNLEKAKSMLPACNNLKLIACKNEDFDTSVLPNKINFFIHTAAPTKSQFFIEHPATTMNASIVGIQKILESIKSKKIEKFVYLSSMEAYGKIEGIANEDNLGYLDLTNIRSCYPEAKRACETYCICYAHEYNLPITICRLAMCFGAGVLPTETRAYMDFIKQAKQNHLITIKSSGQSSLNYISILDAINGLLLLAQNDSTVGQVYNLSNDYENANIRTLAQLIGNLYSVDIHVANENHQAYAPDNSLILDNQKIKSIGYRQINDLANTVEELIDYVEKH